MKKYIFLFIVMSLINYTKAQVTGSIHTDAPAWTLRQYSQYLDIQPITPPKKTCR